MQWPKKNSYKEFDNEKKKKYPAARTFPPPPNGPSLITSPQLAFGRRDRNFMPFAIH